MHRGNAVKKSPRFHAHAKTPSDYQWLTKPTVAASRQLPVIVPPAPRQRSTSARQPAPATSPPINKLRNNPHTLIERRRLPRNRYEKMSGSREDMVRKTTPEPIEPLGELGSLVE